MGFRVTSASVELEWDKTPKFSSVSEDSLCSGIALVNAHGEELAPELLPLFEGYLDRKDVADEGTYDLIRQGGVVCLGTLARHLHTDLKRVSLLSH